MRSVKLQPLTPAAFSAFGDVIESDASRAYPINKNTFSRHDALARVQSTHTDDSETVISVFRCEQATSLPVQVEIMERHPLGSQAIVPWGTTPFIVVVARDRQAISEGRVEAFESNGGQGVNLYAGTWHMPLIAPRQGLEFLVVDRAGVESNCEEITLCIEVQITR